MVESSFDNGKVFKVKSHARKSGKTAGYSWSGEGSGGGAVRQQLANGKGNGHVMKCQRYCSWRFHVELEWCQSGSFGVVSPARAVEGGLAAAKSVSAAEGATGPCRRAEFAAFCGISALSPPPQPRGLKNFNQQAPGEITRYAAQPRKVSANGPWIGITHTTGAGPRESPVALLSGHANIRGGLVGYVKENSAARQRRARQTQEVLCPNGSNSAR